VTGRTDPQGLSADAVEDLAAKAEAFDTWTADRGRLVFRHPMLASIALHLELVPVVDERLPTASTDGRAIYVNPYFLRTLAEAERVFLLAHEVWHNALLHFSRQQGRDHDRWNLATDHEINHLLVDSGMEMPPDGVLFDELAGRSAEEVYEALESFEYAEAEPRGAQADVHLGPDGAVGRCESGRASSSDDSTVFGPIAGKVDQAYPGRLDSDAMGDWPARIVAIAQQHAGLAGRMPGALERLANEIRSPTVPWQTVLRDFVTRANGGTVQWIPPARRHVHRGLYLPSRRTTVLQLAVAIDTSGSTLGYVGRFLSELRGILAAFGRHEVRLLLCDAEVHADRRFSDRDPPVLDWNDLGGGGGTDFRPVFGVLSAEPPTALVYLTDGFGDAPAEGPTYPVLWTLTPNGVRPAPWGRMVALSSEPARHVDA